MTDTKAKEYSKIRIRLTIMNLVVSLVLLSIIAFSPLTFVFRNWAHRLSDNSFIIVFFYFLLFYLFSLIIDFPLDIYSSFFLEHKYKLSNQNFMAWIIDNGKKRLLTIVLGLIMIEGLYAIMRMSPAWWWVWCWAAFILFSLILSKIIPVFIVPLFYKYDEIKDQELKEKILNCVKNTKLKISNIFSLNLSKTTKKANAAFMGLGNTKRVVLSDTLISHFTPQEIEVVVAHEVGHFTLKHIWKHISFATVVYIIAFYCAYVWLSYIVKVFAFNGAADVATFPFICLLFALFGVVIMPLQNAYSRAMEREADAFALRTGGRGDAFVSTMKKLGEINLSDPSPHALIECIFYSHPSIAKRIAWAQSQDSKEKESASL
ncbi:MAG: M48 family metallopeptidase [Candidatus Omnitrophica bacterium]|nr:M48 family metallopeptidase [Candidatus Omnitrophota bacterium]